MSWGSVHPTCRPSLDARPRFTTVPSARRGQVELVVVVLVVVEVVVEVLVEVAVVVVVLVTVLAGPVTVFLAVTVWGCVVVVVVCVAGARV
jgi:hypothetical protein